MSSLNYLMLKLKGGSGSGNFGHSGRKGKRGGSSGGKFSNYLSIESEEIFTKEVLSDYRKGKLSLDDIGEIENLRKGGKPTGLRLANKSEVNVDNVIQLYTGQYHASVNTALRNNSDIKDVEVFTKNGEKVKVNGKDVVSIIDNEIDKSTATSDMKLYRAIPAKIRSPYGKGQMVEGNTISDKAFNSTSTKRNTAEWLVKKHMGGSEGLTVLEINVKKGQKVLDVKKLSSNGAEGEFLLPRNAKLKITDSYYDDDKNITTYVVDYEN